MSLWTEDELRRIGGSGSAWHGVARASGQARIWAGGVEKDVGVEDADDTVYDAVYREKYGRRYAGIVDTITDTEHAATTLRLVPRDS